MLAHGSPVGVPLVWHMAESGSDGVPASSVVLAGESKRSQCRVFLWGRRNKVAAEQLLERGMARNERPLCGVDIIHVFSASLNRPPWLHP